MNCIDGKHSAECVLVTLKKITELTGIIALAIFTLPTRKTIALVPLLIVKIDLVGCFYGQIY